MSSLDEVVAEICRMPLDPHGRSHIDLLERTGYLDHRGELTVERVSQCLAADPALVDAWQQWVDDNRSTPAWYFTTRGPREYEVGNIARDGSTTERLTFDDRTLACADYIVREVDQLAGYAEAWPRPWTALRRRLTRAGRK